MPNYQVVSADSHLEIDVGRWRHRVAAKHRDRAPRRVSLPSGGDAWLVEGQSLRVCGLELAGKPYEEFEITGVTYEGSPGTGSPEQRVAEQDRDGVDAEILFAGVGGPNFWKSIANDESYRAVIHGYNSFLAEEYCAVNPDRLVGMGLIPETGLNDALTELRYCKEAGLKGVTLNSFPAGKTYPTRDDDAFWSEAIEMKMALTAHVALNFLSAGKKQTFQYQGHPETEIAPGARDPIKRIASWAMVGGFNAVQMVMDGVFERNPGLQFYFAESHIGWIPHFLEQFDQLYDRNIHWAKRHFGLQGVDGRPSDYVRRHISWGFLNEPFGVRWRHEMGVDKLMWASDFPHGDGDWPRSKEVIEENFENVPDDERRAMVCGNAVSYFSLA